MYFIKVKNIVPGTEADAMMQMITRRQLQQQVTQQADQMISFILKRNAKIEDNRSNFFHDFTNYFAILHSQLCFHSQSPQK